MEKILLKVMFEVADYNIKQGCKILSFFLIFFLKQYCSTRQNFVPSFPQHDKQSG